MLIRAMTGDNLTHVTLKMPRDRIYSLCALIVVGADFEDRDKDYKYISCLANGETVICSGSEYNKLAWYVKELKVVKKGVKLADVVSDWSESDDEFDTEGAIYSITLQQISCAKTKSAVAGLSPYDAVHHAAMRDLAGERGVALPRTMRTTRSSSPPRQRGWSAARRQSFGGT